MNPKSKLCISGRSRPRAGVAALDFALVLGVLLPVVLLLMVVGPKIMKLVYEMTAVVISWPFM